MSYKQEFTLGSTKVRMEDLPPSAWTYVTGEPDDDGAELYRVVGFLNRCIQIRASAASTVPFGIVRGNGDEPLWESGDTPPPGFDWFEDLQRLFYLTALSTTKTGAAYWHAMRAGRQLDGVRWLLKSSIKPKYAQDGRLSHFTRSMPKDTQKFDVEEIIHFWLPDDDREIGPPKSWPLKAAMRAAGVAENLDEFLYKYFERDMVRASLLVTQTPVSETERERLKSWWSRISGGVKNAFGAEVVRAGSVEVVQVGEGVSEIGNGALSMEKRQEIAVAIGVPLSMVMANAANYATAQQDALNMVQYTTMPDCTFLADIVNRQLLRPLGLRMEWYFDRLEVIQQQQLATAEALQRLAGVPVMTINEARAQLGLDPVPGGDVIAADFGQGGREPQSELPEPAAEVDAEPAKSWAWQDEAGQFRRWYGKRLGADVDEFNANHMSRADKVVIADEMLRQAIKDYP